MADSNNILRPIPQRVWQITPASSDPPSPASPTDDANSAQEAEKDSSTISPSRTRSILNLTSSTLFGIYSPSGPDGASAGGGTFSQANTPWGTGAMTPAISTAASSPRMDFEEQQTSSPTVGSFERLPIPQMAHHPRKQPLLTGTIIPLAGRSTLLFVCGLVYGVMVTYLHDNETLAPVRLEGVHRNTWQYLCFWGGLSVILGNMLPWLDELLEEEPMADKQLSGQRSNRARKESTASRRTLIVEEPDRSDGRDWFSAVRGIGVFIGIAFAIRKLPWESQSQAILTLVLVNPVLWYALDRSQRGFVVSTLGAFAGTLAFMALNPKITRPTESGTFSTRALQPSSLTTLEMVGVATWVASVIFCSCVCFRSIGRTLAFRGQSA